MRVRLKDATRTRTRDVGTERGESNASLLSLDVSPPTYEARPAPRKTARYEQ